jgi:hypothetical protein
MKMRSPTNLSLVREFVDVRSNRQNGEFDSGRSYILFAGGVRHHVK